MRDTVARFRFLAVLLALTGAPAFAAPPETVVGKGELRSLSVLPEKVTLRGADQVQQLVVTGHFANDGLADLTTRAVWRAADPAVAGLEPGGLLVARGNGRTEVTVEVQGKTVKIPVTVEGTEREQPIHFANEIVPLFSKLGCNAGACHGKASGQNGFKLSLLGFEPKLDYEALTREGRGRRVQPAAPEASLLLLKPTGLLPHGGGKRLNPRSRDYQLLLRWVRGGLPAGREDAPTVVGITVAPEQRGIARRATQQITVTAHYSDGSRRDVTRQAEYSSNDPEVAGVGETGLVETHDLPGEGAIMVRYLGHVAVFRATIPQDAPLDRYPQPPVANFIDEHVFARLKQLGIPPSELCSDGEFLRRVALDITGTLPTAAEVEKFLAAKDANKRAKLVDELLERPTYASYFALKWGDILRNRRKGLVGVGGDAARTTALHSWVLDSLRRNKPYDQFVREILTAQGSFTGPGAQPPVAWYNVLREPQALVDDMAQVFLGTRLQCAQCHHHPYEKWSQDDYWGLAAFFARSPLVSAKGVPLKGKAAGDRTGNPVKLMPTGQVVSPQGKVYSNPRPLGEAEITVPAAQDPREKLAEWLVRPDNPYFARAVVNRYWAHFFGRGIVEPLDDMRVSNPPSNPALLDALARDFVAHQFDLKHLVRTLCASTAYQLSSTPNEHNGKDRQNFARYYPRRLPAEVLLDAIDQVTAVPTKHKATPAVNRAIELADESGMTPFLETFGKPARGSACECERVSSPTLAQSLLLLGSPEIHGKLKLATSRAGRLAADSRPLPEKVNEIFLWVYARRPTAEESKAAVDFLARQEASTAASGPRAQTRQWPYEDLLWALLNTKEFLFNH
jgi:hypothetical protein